jgi:hypothetical protein
MIRTTAGQIHVSSYTKIDIKEIARYFGAPKSTFSSELIDYPIDLNTDKLAEFALSTADPKEAIAGLLDAFTEIVAMDANS